MASLVFEAGSARAGIIATEHPKVIQLRLGHSSIQVTLDTYGHLFEGLDEAAADRLDAAFPRMLADSSRTLDSGAVAISR